MGGMRPGVNIPPASAPEIPRMSAEEQTLAVFCQGLMAGAEFRVLN